MAVPIIWRRFRGHFGISAPRMTVTTRLHWWERGAAVLALTAMMAVVVWWAFDFGQIFGGAHHRDVDARQALIDLMQELVVDVEFDLRDGNRIENPALDENHPVVRDGRIWKIECRDEILRVERSRNTRR